MSNRTGVFDPGRFAGAILDMDGVITDTAERHFAAWRRMFDGFLHEQVGPEAEPFTYEDYLEYVDGKPRYDGVDAFLRSRGIGLSRGHPDDPACAQTVCGLGNRKNDYFHEELGRGRVERFDGTVRFVEELRVRDVRVGVISSSRNAHDVLSRAGVAELFDVTVTGVEAAKLGLAGKPAPDIFLAAAAQLETDPGSTIVVEDAVAGVQAAVRGGFGHIIGVDRSMAGKLAEHGADQIVEDLAELLPMSTAGLPTIAELPDAGTAIAGGSQPVAVFLDYDGTLTPIVDDPAEATLPPPTRQVLGELVGTLPVAVVSGRDLDDVRQLVAVDGVAYVGSHGFEILLPDGQRIHELRPDIDWDKGRAIIELRDRMGITGRLLYVGDDVTDEDGFRAVKARGGAAVVVRGEDDRRPTRADGALASPVEVRHFLAVLARGGKQSE